MAPQPIGCFLSFNNIDKRAPRTEKKLSAFSIFVETPVQPLKNISDIEGQDTSTYFFRSRGKKFEGFFPHLNRKSFFSLVVAKNKRFRGSKKLWRGNFFSSWANLEFFGILGSRTGHAYADESNPWGKMMSLAGEFSTWGKGSLKSAA